MSDAHTVPARERPRRSFLARLAGMLAVLPLVDRRAFRFVGGRAGDAQGQPNVALLSALAGAVLPAELGAAGVTRAAGDFQRWMDGYRPGAEANHGYGTGRIERLTADPRAQWRSQLAALEADARRAGSQSFASLSVERRQAIVRTALAGERGEALPSALAARHVALALLAHFYDSPAANDLCYDAQIGRQQCRPLAKQGEQPVALTRGPR